jgi:hypothetical protein
MSIDGLGISDPAQSARGNSGDAELDSVAGAEFFFAVAK